ncbi:hypothetical protein T4B_1813 [Trichinella pseudospiralis]|uniref:Uncharacterized protein n=1 Tax=Trichinella pseudospiralis TaxID=6337 RepID=A0A0V1IUP4_TRIPS|nr:hypothetical protein T4B_1813 [Trichinella pseudospiralis]KRZ26390.1 hypothetical protein T4C_2303 [Trichinella pseudospiralis]
MVIIDQSVDRVVDVLCWRVCLNDSLKADHQSDRRGLFEKLFTHACTNSNHIPLEALPLRSAYLRN